MVRCILVEIKKALLDKGVILVVLGVFLINTINLWDEMQLHQTYESSSVLYYWVNRHGLGGITMLMFLLCSIPYGLQFCLEKNNGSWKYFLIREHFRGYVFSKIVVTVLTSVIAFMVGYLLVFILLHSRYMLFPDNKVFFEQMVSGLPFESIALQRRYLFFFLNIIPEVMMIAFMSTISLLVGTWTENKYVVIATPMVVYYAWNYLTGSLRLHDIFLWTLKIIEGFQYFENDILNLIFTIAYYLTGITVIGCIFLKRCKGDIEDV